LKYLLLLLLLPAIAAPLPNPARYQEILTITSEVAEQDYSEAYNCRNFTISLTKKLMEAGYKPTTLTGYIRGRCHAWVEVEGIWIETTQGLIIQDHTQYQKVSTSFPYCK